MAARFRIPRPLDSLPLPCSTSPLERRSCMEGLLMTMLASGWWRRCGLCMVLLWGATWCGIVPTARAQGPSRSAKFYPDFSDSADALLRNAAGHARDGQWAETVEIYQR